MVDNDERRAAALARLVPEVSTALAAAPDVRAWPLDWQNAGEIDYFYRSASLLAADGDVERVRSALRDLGADTTNTTNTPADASSGIRGVTRLQVQIRDSQHTPDLLADLEDRFGIDVVTHEHVFAITPRGTMCPASEPAVVLTPQQADNNAAAVRGALWPAPVGGDTGRGVQVSVVDTGLLDGVADWAPWLAGVTAGSASDIEDPDTIKIDSDQRGRDGFADPYAGHGSFVAGVIRCLAPGSDIVVERVIGPHGFVAEADMITQIKQGLGRSPDLISMSAGGYTRHDEPPLGLKALWTQRLSQLGGTALVAAAGNDGRSQPFWPAAFDWCVGVGSMARDGQTRSWFSNHGAWVDVYAPGEDVVNAYPRLPYKTIVDGHERDTSAGLVSWSGTSFATPIVTGLIAARMSQTGENARAAAAAVLANARGQHRPGVGPRLFP